MNYGRRGVDLLLDLKRSCDFLPPYNDEGVRSTLQEIGLHYDELQDMVNASSRRSRRGRKDDDDGVRKKSGGAEDVPSESRPALILHDASIRRNKRCLLAYHSQRADKLRSLRWETGNLPPHVRPLLSEAELDFFAEYDRLVSRYSSSPSVDLDLGADRNPPEEERVTVRVVREGLGRVATEYGDGVELDLGTVHHLPRGDVEHLVRVGALVQLDGEECS